MLTRVLAMEWGPDGISAVLPVDGGWALGGASQAMGHLAHGPPKRRHSQGQYCWLDEGAEAGDGAADDQRVDLPGALVGVNGLRVGDEPAYLVLEQAILRRHPIVPRRCRSGVRADRAIQARRSRQSW